MLCRVRKHHVTGIMAERVVDEFETVQVDEQQCNLQPMALCRMYRRSEQLAEQRPIGQARQYVMRCQMLDSILRQLSFGDVGADTAVALESAVDVVHRVPARAGVASGAVGD